MSTPWVSARTPLACSMTMRVVSTSCTRCCTVLEIDLVGLHDQQRGEVGECLGDGLLLGREQVVGTAEQAHGAEGAPCQRRGEAWTAEKPESTMVDRTAASASAGRERGVDCLARRVGVDAGTFVELGLVHLELDRGVAGGGQEIEVLVVLEEDAAGVESGARRRCS